MKTAELIGPALDWVVAKAEGYPTGIWYDEDDMPMVRDDSIPEWKPSTDWSQGGPIIEREKLSVVIQRADAWHASCPRYVFHGYGPTPLIAAMRCYVASRLGDEVEIPEELK